jgi:GntR family transcriptional regulator / MocR family aminotransferase
VSGALIIGQVEGGGRSRGPAFLPAELRPEPHGGLYQSLYKRLRGFILDGVWTPGTRLPSSRALAADLKVSRNTAILAVEQLIADGWAESRSRSGVYVASTPIAAPLLETRAERAALAELPPFALQRPATDLFPAQIWKQLQAHAWAEIEPQRLLSADPAGDPALRETIARLVCAPRGLCCHPDQILVLPSATLAIDLVAATLLRPGDRAVVEDPCRPAVRQLLRARGADLTAVPVDRRGWDLAALPHGARIACVAPTIQFPVSATLAGSARAHVLDWARSAGAWLLEDDRDAEAWLDESAPLPQPLAAAAPDRTILIGSFNRLLFPGLCVAFLVAPPALVERLRSAHAFIGGRASLASQLALSSFITEGHYARHLRRRRQAYAERRALLSGLFPSSPSESAGGLHLLMRTERGLAAEAARRLADERLGGIDLDLLAEINRTASHLLLGIGATPDQIEAHADRLRQVLTPYLARGDR